MKTPRKDKGVKRGPRPPGWVNPMKGRPNGKGRPLAERFWEKVQKADGDACWLWTGSSRHQKYPYGCIWANGKAQWAHRVAWELERGPIPDGMQIDHICKNPQCVRPDHLRLVTPRQNWVDYSDSPIARNAMKTHCKFGHPLTPENIAVKKRTGLNTGNGKRVGKTTTRICLTCRPHEWRHALIPRPRPPGSKVLRTDPDYKPPHEGIENG